jgi:hypothetical protein
MALDCAYLEREALETALRPLTTTASVDSDLVDALFSADSLTGMDASMVTSLRLPSSAGAILAGGSSVSLRTQHLRNAP